MNAHQEHGKKFGGDMMAAYGDIEDAVADLLELTERLYEADDWRVDYVK